MKSNSRISKAVYQEEKFMLVIIHAKLMDNCMQRNKAVLCVIIDAESDINVGTQDIMAQYDCNSALNSCHVIMDLFSNNTQS